jgi:hypothetical protein
MAHHSPSFGIFLQILLSLTLAIMLPLIEESSVVEWIRVGFNADSDPAFYPDTVPDPDPGSQTNAESCGSRSLSDFAFTKNLFFT